MSSDKDEREECADAVSSDQHVHVEEPNVEDYGEPRDSDPCITQSMRPAFSSSTPASEGGEFAVN